PQGIQRGAGAARPGGSGRPGGEKGPGDDGRGLRARARGARGREAHLAQRRAGLHARPGGDERAGLRQAGERRAEPLFVIPRRGHVLPSPTGAPMGKLIAGAVLLFIAFSLLLTAATVHAQRPGPASNLLRVGGTSSARWRSSWPWARRWW